MLGEANKRNRLYFNNAYVLLEHLKRRGCTGLDRLDILFLMPRCFQKSYVYAFRASAYIRVIQISTLNICYICNVILERPKSRDTEYSTIAIQKLNNGGWPTGSGVAIGRENIGYVELLYYAKEALHFMSLDMSNIAIIGSHVTAKQ